ncbi:pyridoxal 5'-phosphate synthase glutaminase subunit PdxT [Saccharopolyspora sp. NPDC003752]
MTKPVIGVLALQGGVAEHLAALERSGADARPVRRAEELAAVQGIVLPGGESTTMTRLLDTFELYEPLRERLAAGLPAYGSCAGMIMLSSGVLDSDIRGDRELPAVRPLGALDVVVRRNAFGRQVDSFETDLEFAGIPDGPVHAVFIRAPWVEKVGDDVDVLAAVPDSGPDDPDTTGRDAAAGRIVAVQQGPVLATAFHPELVGGDERVHRYFVQIVRARLGSTAQA